MSSLGNTALSMASLFKPTGGIGLPPLPGDLGLPTKGVTLGSGIAKGGREGSGPDYRNDKNDLTKLNEQKAQAETYNKAFADLLNQQPQLSGAERKQFYDLYSTKQGGKNEQHYAPLTDFSSILSQAGPMTQAEIAAANQKQQAPQPQAAPQPAPQQAAPQTVGPVPSQAVTPQPTPTPTPQAAPQPEATPTVATSGGNIAGGTTTNSATAKPKGGDGRRGRIATLLTGLGGAVEKFGL